MAQYQGTRRLATPKAATLEKVLRTRSLKRRTRPVESFFRILLLLCGLVSILSTAGILYTLGENSLLFFRQRSWQQVKFDTVERAEVTNLGQEVTLAADLTAQDQRLMLNLDERATLPFHEGQVIELGSEQMRVLAASRAGLDVERGINGSLAVNHGADAPVFLHNERTVLLGVDVAPGDNVIQLVEGAAACLQGGQSAARGRGSHARPECLADFRHTDCGARHGWHQAGPSRRRSAALQHGRGDPG